MFISPKLVYETIYLESTVEDIYKTLGVPQSANVEKIKNAMAKKILDPIYNIFKSWRPDPNHMLENLEHEIIQKLVRNRKKLGKVDYKKFLELFTTGNFIKTENAKTADDIIQIISKKLKKPKAKIDSILKNTYVIFKKISLNLDNFYGITKLESNLWDAVDAIKKDIHRGGEFYAKVRKFEDTRKSRLNNILAIANKKAKEAARKAEELAKETMRLNEEKSTKILHYKNYAAIVAGSGIFLGGIAAIYKLVGKKAPIPWYKKIFKTLGILLGGAVVIAIFYKLFAKYQANTNNKKFENDISSLMLESFNRVNVPILESGLISKFSDSVKSVFVYPLKVVKKISDSIFTRFKDKTGFSFLEVVFLFILGNLIISIINIILVIVIQTIINLLT